MKERLHHIYQHYLKANKDDLGLCVYDIKNNEEYWLEK